MIFVLSGKRAPNIVVFIGKISSVFLLPSENITHGSTVVVPPEYITHKQFCLKPRITYQWPNTKYPTPKIPKTHPRFNATIKNMEAACANLYYVDPESEVLFRAGIFSDSLNDCGYRFVTKCRNISNCLKAFAYIYNIPCKNTIFSTLRSIQQTCITFKGANVKPTVSPKLPPIRINLRTPTLQELETAIQARADIPFHIEQTKFILPLNAKPCVPFIKHPLVKCSLR